MSNLPKSSPRGRRFPLGLFVSGFAIGNFVTPLIMIWMWGPNPFVFMTAIGILVGSMAGQCGLLAIWGVLGPFRATARLTITLTIGVVLMTSFGMGVAIVEQPDDNLGEMMCPLLFLPLFLLAVQLPLWVFKIITGRRIIHVGSHAGQSTTPQQQFGLQHVMGGTVVVAVALSLASSGLLILDAQEAENWIPLLAACLYGTVVSTFATLPCLWAGMIARNKQAAAGIIAIYTMLMSLLLVVILGLLSSGTMPWKVVVVFIAFHVSLMAVILGTLHVARLCGYTFVSRRRPLQPVIETGSRFPSRLPQPRAIKRPNPGLDSDRPSA